MLLRTFRVVEKKKNGIKNDTFPHFISVRTATVHTFFRNDQSIRISYWLASQFFFFFLAVCCCVVLTTNRARWSRKISSIFISFHFRLVKKEVYGAVFEISVASCHRGPLSSFLSSPFLFLLTLVSFVEHLGRSTLLPAPWISPHELISRGSDRA